MERKHILLSSKLNRMKMLTQFVQTFLEGEKDRQRGEEKREQNSER